MTKGSKSVGKKQPRSDKPLKVNVREMRAEVNANINTVWVDRMQVFLRSDALGMVSFATLIPPERLVEVGRFQMSVAHLKDMVNVLCRSLDYYPKKEASEPPG